MRRAIVKIWYTSAPSGWRYVSYADGESVAECVNRRDALIMDERTAINVKNLFYPVYGSVIRLRHVNMPRKVMAFVKLARNTERQCAFRYSNPRALEWARWGMPLKLYARADQQRIAEMWMYAIQAFLRWAR